MPGTSGRRRRARRSEPRLPRARPRRPRAAEGCHRENRRKSRLPGCSSHTSLLRVPYVLLLRRAVSHRALQLGLALSQSLANLLERHVGLARLREHAVALLLFLDVMPDHFRKHVDPCVKILVIGPRLLDLQDEVFGACVLDFGLVMDLLIACCFEKCGVENLLLDLRMDPQGLTDRFGELGLLPRHPRLLELLEPALDLTMIRLQEGDRIVTLSIVGSARGSGGPPTDPVRPALRGHRCLLDSIRCRWRPEVSAADAEYASRPRRQHP